MPDFTPTHEWRPDALDHAIPVEIVAGIQGTTRVRTATGATYLAYTAEIAPAPLEERP